MSIYRRVVWRIGVEEQTKQETRAKSSFHPENGDGMFLETYGNL
jgi:hypothetical protein